MNRLFEYVANHPLLVAATALVAIVAIVLELRQRSRGSAAVGTTDAVLLANQGALMLDVRTDEQYAEGHIIDARHIKSSDLEASLDSLKKYREKPVVVYCDSGAISASLARIMKASGFAKVANLKGGLQAWKQDNLPLVKDAVKTNNSRNSPAKGEKGAKPA